MLPLLPDILNLSVSSEQQFSPEELIGMILEKAKIIAEKFAEHPITEAVVTVPPFFNQAERRAMYRAVEMGGLKVLQLMNDNAAGMSSS